MKKLEISLGHDCNASCIFCHSALAKNKLKMPNNKIKSILLNYAKKEYKHISFTGGEPTIRKDIFDLIVYAKEVGYKYIDLKTNLFMLSYPSFVKKLENSGLNSISFSVFGFGDESYSKITGIVKSYSYLLKALKNLEYSNISSSANILISKYSYKDLSKIINLLLSYKIKSFSFWYISTNELKKNKEYLLPSFSSFKKELFSSIKILTSKNIKKIKILHIPPCLLKNYAKYYYNERNEDITLIDLMSTFNIKNESFADLIKVDKCNLCNKNDICAGLRKEYYNKFGDSEIIPYFVNKINSENDVNDKL